jgi:hypothetical protein
MGKDGLTTASAVRQTPPCKSSFLSHARRWHLLIHGLFIGRPSSKFRDGDHIRKMGRFPSRQNRNSPSMTVKYLLRILGCDLDEVELKEICPVFLIVFASKNGTKPGIISEPKNDLIGARMQDDQSDAHSLF